MNARTGSPQTNHPCKPVVAIAGAVLLLAATALMSGCGRGKAAGPGAGRAAQAAEDRGMPVSVITVRRGTIREELEITGTCEAYEEVDVVPEVSGKVVGVAVDIGDHVNQGYVLVRLDTSLVSKQRVQAERGVDSASAQLNQAVETAGLTDSQTLIEIRQAEQGVAAATELVRKAQEGYKLTSERVDSQIEQAKVALASAQASQRDVFAGARNQEIAQAEASVRQAEADLALKKTNHERYSRLYADGAVAEATLDQYRTQYEVAQQALTQARQGLSLAKEGARQEQKRMAQLGVDQATQQLRLAEASSREIEIAARDVESAKVGLRQAEEALRLARAGRRRYSVSVAGVKAAKAGVNSAAAHRDYASTTERKYTIVAPVSGSISLRNVDVGEGASPAMAVMRIVNNDPIRVNCVISELDIAKVAQGDGGTATVDGLPGREFFGRVVDISPQARRDERSYTARVEIDNPDASIKAGMFARVRIVLSEKHDTIVVPRDALAERDRVRQAYVVNKNNAVEIRKVKTGVSNGRRIEVISGLKAGEKVVVGSQALLAKDQKVKPVPAKQAEEAGPIGPLPAVSQAESSKPGKKAPAAKQTKPSETKKKAPGAAATGAKPSETKKKAPAAKQTKPSETKKKARERGATDSGRPRRPDARGPQAPGGRRPRGASAD